MAKSSRAFLIAYDEQPDLAKFCRAGSGQNLAKSGCSSLCDEKCAARFGQILPGGCPAKFGQIDPRISHRVRRAARFGQILPGACPAKIGQIEPRLSGGRKLFNCYRIRRAARFGQILPADCPGKIGQIEPLVFNSLGGFLKVEIIKTIKTIKT